MATDHYLAPSPLEAAYHSGNEDRLVEELRKAPGDKSRRQRRTLILFKILKETKSPRVRNAAALALADMKMKNAKPQLVEILCRKDTKGNRGTLLYALEELNVDVPLSLLIEILLNDAYEAREEVLDLIEKERIEYDIDVNTAIRKLRRALRSADEERSHAIENALEMLKVDRVKQPRKFEVPLK